MTGAEPPDAEDHGHGPGSHSSVPRRMLGIGSAVAMMVWAVLLVASWMEGREEVPAHPEVGEGTSAGTPIAAEWGVFRLHPADVTIDPGTIPRRQAHQRTLAAFRRLRAYPGAPPRIPHGLTSEEFRGTRCNTCHERGGYAQRFDAYAPITPHPEYGQCLQCHAPDDAIVGMALPRAASGETCGQCHVEPGVRPFSGLVALDWVPARWPATGQRALEGSPPAIPHDLQMRGNCLACHGGLHAVEEIRTPHPERASCRQCHVPAAAEEDVFVRPSAGGGAP